ncbi:hypothetical protein, partial [Corynebacterium bovis]|uniref:hypothetical protein n=1 Tax=Corynebacterium bovis TaxID=36808 RepID=UPI000F6557C4
MTSGNGNDRQRQRLVAEAVLGFLGFFTVLALVQAVWNLFRDEPSVGPSVLLLVLLVLTWLAAGLAWARLVAAGMAAAGGPGRVSRRRFR